ncbi:MAG: hypothetical protein DHS20C15_26120 [Planctomycetota bacterium]|nr:MAG: hypothetical protein DHS20C15_26120 [Planctomycetota bacterium]
MIGELIAPAYASLAEWAAHWWTWIAPLSVQLAALALPLWWLDRLWTRSGRLRLRALLWSAVLLRVVWPGDLGVLSWDAPAALRGALHAAQADSPPLGGLASGANSLVGAELSSSAGRSATSSLDSFAAWLPALALLWALGAVLGGALHAHRCRRARRSWGVGSALSNEHLSQNALRTELRALATRLGLRRRPRVRLHADLAAPLVDGVWRPTLRLPRDLVKRFTAHAREHILLHELAHLRRRDPLRAAAQALLAQLLWFHPVARLALSRLHTLREQACDELAAQHAHGGRAAYRRTLLEEAARTLLPERAQPGLALLGRRAPLIERLERLGRGPARASRAALPLLAAVGVALLPVHASEKTAPARALAADRTVDIMTDIAEVSAHPSLVARLNAPSDTPTLKSLAEPVPGAAVGCFNTRMLVMAELARQQAGHDAAPTATSHAWRSTSSSLRAQVAPRSPNSPSLKDAEP